MLSYILMEWKEQQHVSHTTSSVKLPLVRLVFLLLLLRRRLLRRRLLRVLLRLLRRLRRLRRRRRLLRRLLLFIRLYQRGFRVPKSTNRFM